MIGFGTKLLIRVLLNGLGLYLAGRFLPAFTLEGGIPTLVISALLIALLYSLARPLLRFVTAPLVWITFGLFNIAINMALLWAADLVLDGLTIGTIPTLFYLSLIIALANIF